MCVYGRECVLTLFSLSLFSVIQRWFAQGHVYEIILIVIHHKVHENQTFCHKAFDHRCIYVAEMCGC